MTLTVFRRICARSLCGYRQALRRLRVNKLARPAVRQTRRCALPIQRETVFALCEIPNVCATMRHACARRSEGSGCGWKYPVKLWDGELGEFLIRTFGVDRVLVARLREALKKIHRALGVAGRHGQIHALAVGVELLVVRASLGQNLAIYRPRGALDERGLSTPLHRTKLS